MVARLQFSVAVNNHLVIVFGVRRVGLWMGLLELRVRVDVGPGAGDLIRLDWRMLQYGENHSLVATRA